MHFFKDFFTISYRERKGILFLVALIVIVNVAMYFPEIFIPEQGKYNYASFQAEILAAENVIEAENESSHQDKKNYTASNGPFTSKKASSMFYFDPNFSSEEELISLGFFPTLAKRIVSYRSKGGRFNSGEDLLKIYGMKESFFKTIKPWIRISEEQTIDKKSSAPVVKTITVLDLNSADSLALIELPGIGPALASRIMKYRNSLGGFYSLNQVKEIYGLSEETFVKISPQLELATSWKKININSCSVNDLKNHPYLKGKIPYVIINYRDKHGPYAEVSGIMNTDLVDEELYRKIAPYLTVE